MVIQGLSQPKSLNCWARRLWIAVILLLSLRLFDALLRGDGDVAYYRNAALDTEGVPGWNSSWAYPPIAGLFMIPMRVISLDHAHIYVALAIALGSLLACWVVIWRSGMAWRHLSFFYVALSAGTMGILFYLRFDMATVALVLAALIALGKGRDWTAGAFMFVGGLVKSWPLAIAAVAGTAMGRWRVLTGVMIGAIATTTVGGIVGAAPWSWISFARGRELHAESFAALPALWGRFFGAEQMTVDVEFYGVIAKGPGLATSFAIVLALVGGGAAWVTWTARYRLFAPKPNPFLSEQRLAYVLLATTCLLIASPVLSPQFIIWLVPPIAVALGHGWLKREAILSLVAMALSSAIYPYLYESFLQGESVALLVITTRDVVLIAIAVSAAARVVRPVSNETEVAETHP
jgi:hypothetical protein